MHKNLFTILALLVSQLSFSQKDLSKSWIDQLCQSTIAFGKDEVVNFRESNGAIVKKRVFNIIGTGIIFYIKIINGRDTIVAPTIVTAKHVFFNPEENYYPNKLNIRFKWDDKRPLDEYFGIPLSLTDNSNKSLWFPHPDSTVDLACILLNYDEKANDHEIKILKYGYITSLENSYEGQEIFALGFPGVGGLSYATKPIIRRGIISWISPTNSDKVPYLIDCDIFPGNSGGPIFSLNSGINQFGGLNVGGDISFLGIVSKQLNKINLIASENYKFLNDDKGGKILSIETFSLGIIEPASRIRELLEYFQNTINHH